MQKANHIPDIKIHKNPDAADVDYAVSILFEAGGESYAIDIYQTGIMVYAGSSRVYAGGTQDPILNTV